jgi:integrase
MLRKTSNGWHDDFSRRFNRRLRRLGVTERRKSAYSFRHSFIDRLINADVPTHTVARSCPFASRLFPVRA